MRHPPSRRDLLRLGSMAIALPTATGLFGCAARFSQRATSTDAAMTNTAFLPIVFMPGNGDTAALWTTTIWRFESNGWPRELLHATDVPYPLARDDDSRPQPGRTSTADQLAHLAAEVDRVLAKTGARQVVLIGNSRGGYAIRNYVAHGGAACIAAVALGGVPNHGVWADAAFSPNSEFNGAGPFLTALNAPQGSAGNEVAPGIRWLTVRSDRNDKYAQPDSVWIGRKGTPSHVGFDGPALKGAENVVIAGIDHRETSFSARAFEPTWRFVAGRAPTTLAIEPEVRVVLDGMVSGLGRDNREGSFVNNLPLVGAIVAVYAVDPKTGERRGPARTTKTIGPDGRWGPFVADGSAHHEFVVRAPGYATTHIYRSPFPRSSSVVSLRAERLSEAERADAALRSLVVLTRPRGYFGVPRDRIVLDGHSPPAGIPEGVAGVSTARARVTDAAGRAVVGEFNGERLVGRAWPSGEGHIVFLELTD